MKIKIVFGFSLFLIFIMLSFFVIAEPLVGQEETQFTFDEPQNLFQRVNSYDTLFLWCPEENSFSKIREKMDKISDAIREVADEEIYGMIDECENTQTFSIKGRKMEEDINECTQTLTLLLENNLDENIEYSREHILEECEIRAYFNERFNEETVENYDKSFFDTLFEKRNEDFIKKTISVHERRKNNFPTEEGDGAKHPDTDDSVIKVSDGELKNSLHESTAILPVDNVENVEQNNNGDYMNIFPLFSFLKEKILFWF